MHSHKRAHNTHSICIGPSLFHSIRSLAQCIIKGAPGAPTCADHARRGRARLSINRWAWRWVRAVGVKWEHCRRSVFISLRAHTRDCVSQLQRTRQHVQHEPVPVCVCLCMFPDVCLSAVRIYLRVDDRRFVGGRKGGWRVQIGIHRTNITRGQF